jgi:hypothetical protein
VSLSFDIELGEKSARPFPQEFPFRVRPNLKKISKDSVHFVL